MRVAALITIDDKIVLVRHRFGSRTYHLLPGGGVSYGESLRDALVREVREETGLEVALEDVLFLNDTIDPSGSRHIVNITFAARRTGGEITSHPQDDRVEAVDLVEPASLIDMDLRPPIGASIVSALDSSSTRPCYLGSLFIPEHREGSP